MELKKTLVRKNKIDPNKKTKFSLIDVLCEKEIEKDAKKKYKFYS